MSIFISASSSRRRFEDKEGRKGTSELDKRVHAEEVKEVDEADEVKEVEKVDEVDEVEEL